MGRILIKGGSIISMDMAIKNLPRGDVLVEDDRTATVAPSLGADGTETIDAAGMIVLPGLINAHVRPHLAERAAWYCRRLDGSEIHETGR